MISKLLLVTADFDGCSFGVLAGPSLLALKPWRVVTSSIDLARGLRQRRCSGDHPHGQLSREWATRLGHYTDLMFSTNSVRLDLYAMASAPSAVIVCSSFAVFSSDVSWIRISFTASLSLRFQVSYVLVGLSDPSPGCAHLTLRITLASSFLGFLHLNTRFMLASAFLGYVHLNLRIVLAASVLRDCKSPTARQLT